MASSSHGGTPSASDIRRERAARLSISPIQDFGSPSFSLGLEKVPPPPTFDGCLESGAVQNSREKQTLKRKRVVDDTSVPSFSLGLDDIPPPQTFVQSKEGTLTTVTSVKQILIQSHRSEIRDLARSLRAVAPCGTFPAPESSGCSNTVTTTNVNAGHQLNRGRLSEVCGAPLFPLGFDISGSSPEYDVTQSRTGKQDSKLRRTVGDHSVSSPFFLKRGNSVFSAVDLPQIFDATETQNPINLLPPPSSRSPSKTWSNQESDQKRPWVSALQPVKEEDYTQLQSTSLVGHGIGPTARAHPLGTSEEPSPRQIARSGRTALPKNPTNLQKYRLTSDADRSEKDDDEQVHWKRRLVQSSLPSEWDPIAEKVRPSKISPARSNRDERLEPRKKELPSSSKQVLSSELKDDTVSGNSSHDVDKDRSFDRLLNSRRPSIAGAVLTHSIKVEMDCLLDSNSKDERELGKKSKNGESLPSPSAQMLKESQCPTSTFERCLNRDLAAGRDENPLLDQTFKRRHVFTSSQENFVEDYRELEPNDQPTAREKSTFVNISNPTSSSRRELYGPQPDIEGGSQNILQDNEGEEEMKPICKLRGLSKPLIQVKPERRCTTNHLEGLSTAGSPSTGTRSDALDSSSPDREPQRVFKRLRRGSLSAAKEPSTYSTVEPKIDLDAGLKKVKAELRDSSSELSKQGIPSASDFEKEIAKESQQTDLFDDIEDFSEDEMQCAGTKGFGNRRSLRAQVSSRKSSLSSPSPSRKPVLHIPGLISGLTVRATVKSVGKVKAEPLSTLDLRTPLSRAGTKTGKIKAEPITLSDDDEAWPKIRRSNDFLVRNMAPDACQASTMLTQNEKPIHGYEGEGSRSHVHKASQYDGTRKHKFPIRDGSDLWKSYTERFTAGGTEGLMDDFAGGSTSVQIRLAEDGGIADLLRQRLPHFKPIDALLLDGGLDQEPVYIDYKNQFGKSQGMDSAAFSLLDCSQPQLRKKQRRPAGKSTKGKKGSGAQSAAISSPMTTSTKSSPKGKRKAWTLFREKSGRASASASTSGSGNGYWIVENGKKASLVYVKDGRTLTGKSAYSAYKKDKGKKPRKTKKKTASKSKR